MRQFSVLVDSKKLILKLFFNEVILYKFISKYYLLIYISFIFDQDDQ